MGFDWKRVAEKSGLKNFKTRLELSDQITELEKSISHLEQNCRVSEESDKPSELYGIVFDTSKKDPLKVDQESMEILMEQRGKLEHLRAQAATLDNSRTQQETVAREMAGMKIETAAVIPAKLWDEICDKYLWRFEHLSEDGRTGAYPGSKLPSFMVFFFMMAVVSPVIYYFAGIYAFAAFALCVLSNILMYAGVNSGDIDSGEPFVIIGMLAMIIGFAVNIYVFGEMSKGFSTLARIGMIIGGIFAYVILFVGNMILTIEARDIYNRSLSKPSYLRAIWPAKVDQEVGPRVKVNFRVQATAEYSSLFERLSMVDIKPMIAVTEDAIMVDNTSLENTGQGNGKPAPVIYSRHGDMVAIHTRTGEFADEESVMRLIDEG